MTDVARLHEEYALSVAVGERSRQEDPCRLIVAGVASWVEHLGSASGRLHEAERPWCQRGGAMGRPMLVAHLLSWGAIGFSAVALGHCHAADARIVLCGQNGYLALARGQDNSFGWDADSNAVRARDQAIAACPGPNPRIVALFHSFSGPYG